MNLCIFNLGSFICVVFEFVEVFGEIVFFVMFCGFEVGGEIVVEVEGSMFNVVSFFLIVINFCVVFVFRFVVLLIFLVILFLVEFFFVINLVKIVLFKGKILFNCFFRVVFYVISLVFLILVFCNLVLIFGRIFVKNI